jgi:NAD(P)-dependent dehydrogenase (short-subunit alcohol dehydrogenase family)
MACSAAAAAAAAAGRFSLVGQGALVTGGTKGIGLAIAQELTQLGATVVACARNVDDAATRELPEGVHAVQADVASRSEREALMVTTEAILRENGTPLSILINSERPCQCFPHAPARPPAQEIDLAVRAAGLAAPTSLQSIQTGWCAWHSYVVATLTPTLLLRLRRTTDAGTNVRKPTVDYSADDFERVMSTNFESAFHLSQLAHPILRASVAPSSVAAHAKEAPRSASIVMVSSVSGGPSTTNTGTVYAATKAAMNQFTRNVRYP